MSIGDWSPLGVQLHRQPIGITDFRRRVFVGQTTEWSFYFLEDFPYVSSRVEGMRGRIDEGFEQRIREEAPPLRVVISDEAAPLFISVVFE